MLTRPRLIVNLTPKYTFPLILIELKIRSNPWLYSLSVIVIVGFVNGNFSGKSQCGIQKRLIAIEKKGKKHKENKLLLNDLLLASSIMILVNKAEIKQPKKYVRKQIIIQSPLSAEKIMIHGFLYLIGIRLSLCIL